MDWLDWQNAPEVIKETEQQPDVSFLTTMQRRRLSRLARMVFHVAWPLAKDYVALPMVLACRHGETPRTLALLKELASKNPLSPTQFSLSVHNAIIGQWSILRKDQSEMTALAAEGDGLEHGLLEARCLLNEGAPAVLLVIAEEAPPSLYAAEIDDVPFSYAVALLITPGQEWTLELQAGDGPRSHWPHALSLIGAICLKQATLHHYWKGRRWTWLHAPN